MLKKVVSFIMLSFLFFLNLNLAVASKMEESSPNNLKNEIWLKVVCDDFNQTSKTIEGTAATFSYWSENLIYGTKTAGTEITVTPFVATDGKNISLYVVSVKDGTVVTDGFFNTILGKLIQISTSTLTFSVTPLSLS